MGNRQISCSETFQKICIDNPPTRRWNTLLRQELHTVTSFQKNSLEGSLEWGKVLYSKELWGDLPQLNDEGQHQHWWVMSIVHILLMIYWERLSPWSFLIPFLNTRNWGPLEKWLILRVGQNIHKVGLKHKAPESKEVLKNKQKPQARPHWRRFVKRTQPTKRAPKGQKQSHLSHKVMLILCTPDMMLWT